MVVDAAFANVPEGQLYQREAALVTAFAATPEQFEERRLRKFWRAPEATIDRIHRARDLLRKTVEIAAADHHASFRPGPCGEALHQGASVRIDALGLVPEQPGELMQHVDEAG